MIGMAIVEWNFSVRFCWEVATVATRSTWCLIDTSVVTFDLFCEAWFFFAFLSLFSCIFLLLSDFLWTRQLHLALDWHLRSHLICSARRETETIGFSIQKSSDRPLFAPGPIVFNVAKSTRVINFQSSGSIHSRFRRQCHILQTTKSSPPPLPLRTFPCPLSLISICPNFAKLKSFSTWFSHHDTFHSKRWRPPNLPPTHKYHPQSKLLWWSSFQQMSKWNVTNVAWNKNRTNIWSYPLLCVELQN